MSSAYSVAASRVASALLWCLLIWSSSSYGHHVLGRPSYSLNEDSNTPPSMQVETRIGDFFVTYMVFPAFPRPDEPGRVNLYASRIDNGAPFQGQVTFKVKDDAWFSNKEELLGTQAPDDNVFRQGFMVREEGDYIIIAEFESGGEPYRIDFPLRIGTPWPIGPIGLSLGALIIVLLAINILQRKRLLRGKIREAREEPEARS